MVIHVYDTRPKSPVLLGAFGLLVILIQACSIMTKYKIYLFPHAKSKFLLFEPETIGSCIEAVVSCCVI